MQDGLDLFDALAGLRKRVAAILVGTEDGIAQRDQAVGGKLGRIRQLAGFLFGLLADFANQFEVTADLLAGIGHTGFGLIGRLIEDSRPVSAASSLLELVAAVNWIAD